MAALEAAYSIIFASCLQSSPKYPLCPNSSPPSIRLHISNSTPTVSLTTHHCPLPLLSINSTRNLAGFRVFSAVEEIAVEEKPEETTQLPNQKRKLFVYNLPWSLTVDEIKSLFGECGTVADVEIIKQKDGKSRGFAFVTMESGEVAQAVIDKFNSHELSGRPIRIEFAKRFKKPPSPPPPAGPPSGETRHKLYVSNLAWKARSTHLKEFFAADFNPVATRVVFDGPSGKSAGYGFVSFATKEEAESAMSALDGKELLGRPLRLKFSERNTVEATVGKEEEGVSEEPQQS